MINITLLPFYIWIVDLIVRSFKELGRFLLVLRILIFIALVSALYFGIQNFGLRGMIAIVVVTAITEKSFHQSPFCENSKSEERIWDFSKASGKRLFALCSPDFHVFVLPRIQRKIAVWERTSRRIFSDFQNESDRFCFGRIGFGNLLFDFRADLSYQRKLFRHY